MNDTTYGFFADGNANQHSDVIQIPLSILFGTIQRVKSSKLAFATWSGSLDAKCSITFWSSKS